MTTNTALVLLQAATQPAVTLITALAEAGDLSDFEYRQIYDRVADGRSLRNVELALQSAVTFGWWGKYAVGEKTLNRERKNELRAWAGLPLLPPSVDQAVAAGAHPDAAVYQVGTQIASRVVLIGADVAAVNLRINGNVTVADGGPVLESHQTPCNRRYTKRPRWTIHLDRGVGERLNAARLRRGATWEEFIGKLEEATDE